MIRSASALTVSGGVVTASRLRRADARRGFADARRALDALPLDRLAARADFAPERDHALPEQLILVVGAQQAHVAEQLSEQLVLACDEEPGVLDVALGEVDGTRAALIGKLVREHARTNAREEPCRWIDDVRVIDLGEPGGDEQRVECRDFERLIQRQSEVADLLAHRFSPVLSTSAKWKRVFALRRSGGFASGSVRTLNSRPSRTSTRSSRRSRLAIRSCISSRCCSISAAAANPSANV